MKQKRLIMVGDETRNNILVYDQSGKLLDSWGTQVMLQEQTVSKHCHHVRIDDDENIYVCQWNADQTYPIKLERV